MLPCPLHHFKFSIFWISAFHLHFMGCYFVMASKAGILKLKWALQERTWSNTYLQLKHTFPSGCWSTASGKVQCGTVQIVATGNLRPRAHLSSNKCLAVINYCQVFDSEDWATPLPPEQLGWQESGNCFGFGKGQDLALNSGLVPGLSGYGSDSAWEPLAFLWIIIQLGDCSSCFLAYGLKAISIESQHSVFCKIFQLYFTHQFVCIYFICSFVSFSSIVKSSFMTIFTDLKPQVGTK